MTKVKGTAIIPLPKFIAQEYGQEGFARWLEAISPAARKTYSQPILVDQWYPLTETFVEPTVKMCDLFSNGILTGAWKVGRFSADYSLKGVYKAFVKLGSIQSFNKRAGVILPAYYEPCAIETVVSEATRSVMHITIFPEIHTVVENRICGWIQRAVEIHGRSRVKVEVAKSLTRNDPYTEIVSTWD